MSGIQTPKVRLDWSRLLGFDQAGSAGEEGEATRLSATRLGRIGVKLGPKPGMKPTNRSTV